MNRDEFAHRMWESLLQYAHLCSHDFGPTSEEQATNMAEDLWPLLAQVWEDGHSAGRSSVMDRGYPEPLNPYSQPIDSPPPT